MIALADPASPRAIQIARQTGGTTSAGAFAAEITCTLLLGLEWLCGPLVVGSSPKPLTLGP